MSHYHKSGGGLYRIPLLLSSYPTMMAHTTVHPSSHLIEENAILKEGDESSEVVKLTPQFRHYSLPLPALHFVPINSPLTIFIELLIARYTPFRRAF